MYTGENVRRVADDRVSPVEDVSVGCVRLRSQRRHERLNEGQTGGDAADHRVRVVGDRLGDPAVEVDEYDYQCRYITICLLIKMIIN